MTLKSHVVITGDTHIGAHSTVFSFAVIGEIPQDLKFAGERTSLRIGARNRIREHVTMNTGTAGGGGVTRIGDDGLFMAGCHIAHDAQIGNRVIVVNGSAVAGHCIIADDVIIGGLSGIHQFVRIGRGAIIGALTMVTNDVIPYGAGAGAARGARRAQPGGAQAQGRGPGRHHRPARRLSGAQGRRGHLSRPRPPAGNRE